MRSGKLRVGLVVRSDMDVIKAVYEAFTERDVEGVIAHLDDDVEFSAVTGDHAGRTEPYRGHDGVRQYFRDLAEVWDELRIVPGEYRKDGDTTLVTGRVTARSPARIVAGSTGWIWRLRDGLVVYVRVYPSAADAMAAFEGAPPEGRVSVLGVDAFEPHQGRRRARRR